ncbi:DEAD/DEAH box helicase family protein [Candidatus Poriferisocius sp.]|uniref:DEAD/DEAH box helicase family protein n=1 Tax=Candidatus Poriferisocius sp. TaxID=3101276 RepID=UPI003B0161C8
MLADESSLQPGLYRLPEAPIGPKVLIPGFRSATSVRGAFGWFTAGWIERLAPGLAEYLSRPDTAPIRFTVAPVFFPEERRAVEQGSAMTVEEAAQRVADVFVEGRVDATALGQHALDCLAWMVAADRLRLRVAVPNPDSNYHPKIWLFDDGSDQVLVRGSANATGRGLSGGVEHMDVDVSWNEPGHNRVATGIGILDDWEQGISMGIEQTVDLPDALRDDIIKTAPAAAPTPDHYLQAAGKSSEPPWAVEARDPLEELRDRFARRPAGQDRPRLAIPAWLEWQTGDYSHQAEAVTAWESEPDPESGTISMATGAGKTLTALVCATRAQDRLGDTPLLIVVSAPSVPLITQWEQEIRRFGVNAATPTLAPHTNTAISRLLQSLSGGGTHIAVVTNNLLCDAAFQNTVASHIDNASRPLATMLIGDEAHTLGAASFIANKPEFFERRLALSATPERQYDPDGTEEIFEFFGPPVYEFGLDRAIGFCLVPYDYYVHATTLDGDELEQFKELTDRIRRLAFRLNDKDDDRDLTSLLIRRRRIIETAESKIPLLSAVLRHRGPRSLTQALVYASAKNPEQFDNIGGTLTGLDVRWAPVTQKTTASTAQLDKTLATFAVGGFQVLLAKKVLDEGVDIPSIREAFLVASSTVEREWVQRRGRVLRRHPGKPWAVLHDFVALPPADLFRDAGRPDDDLKKIVRSELSRAYSFAAHARNATGADGVLAHLDRVEKSYWPTNGAAPVLESAGDHIIAPATPEGSRW